MREMRPIEHEPISQPAQLRGSMERPTNLYVMQAIDGDPFKIGIAQNIQSRLAQLQAGNPKRLKVVCSVDGVDSTLERKLHARYAKYRLSGEWFDECILGDVTEVLS